MKKPKQQLGKKKELLKILEKIESLCKETYYQKRLKEDENWSPQTFMAEVVEGKDRAYNGGLMKLAKWIMGVYKIKNYKFKKDVIYYNYKK